MIRHRSTATLLTIAASVAASVVFGAATSAVAQSAEITTAVQERAGDRPPRVYFLPMRGQMGTDIHPSIYRDVVKDIRSVDPDLIVFMLEGSDPEEGVFHFGEQDFDPTDQSLLMIAEYRDIVRIFRDDLRDIPQVMWVHNSVGFSSLMALAWPHMYMQPTAKLAGLNRILGAVMGWRDVEVRAKMLSAWVGVINGFLERGGYPLALGDAMMRPEKYLSVSFKGREVTWSLDTEGHWIIDGNPRGTASFTAQLAEDVGLARGLAEEPDDLIFLLGFREYEAVGDGERITTRYVEDWRRSMEQTESWLLDYRDAMRWARGEDEQRYLGQAIRTLERIQSAMRRYDAVAIRWRVIYGLDVTELDIWIDRIRERIRALRQRGRGGAGGGLGGGGGLSGSPRR